MWIWGFPYHLCFKVRSCGLPRCFSCLLETLSYLFIFMHLFVCSGSSLQLLGLVVAVCGISVPGPRIQGRAPALGAQSLIHWTTREVLRDFVLLDIVPTPVRTSCWNCVSDSSPRSSNWFIHLSNFLTEKPQFPFCIQRTFWSIPCPGLHQEGLTETWGAVSWINIFFCRCGQKLG